MTSWVFFFVFFRYFARLTFFFERGGFLFLVVFLGVIPQVFLGLTQTHRGWACGAGL